ncbi:MAG TPA: glycosyl hydrolase family 18 [Verrucomicrobia bacterium]|nr:glycosyl hydrolase family 18 [Verrucomicrobiota bacterium]
MKRLVFLLAGLAAFVGASSCVAAVTNEPCARWIAVAPGVPRRAATAFFARDWILGADIRRATLRTSGLGVYELTVNGVRTGDPNAVLRPGFTTPGKTRQLATFDVTDLVRRADGRCAIRAFVSNAWWGDACTGVANGEPGFYAELEVADGAGDVRRHGTDGRWTGSWAGPVQTAGIFEGEDYDARAANPPDPTVSVRVLSEAVGVFRPEEDAAVVRREDLALRPVAASIWRTNEVTGADAAHDGKIVARAADFAAGDIRLAKGDMLLVDFGQNAAAHPRLSFSGAAGVRARIRVAEMLNDGNGAKTRSNDGPEGSLYHANYKTARSEINYTFAGTGVETYQPAFTYFGYRYLSLVADGDIRVRSILSVPVTSVRRELGRGTVETGHVGVNRLIQNCEWGMYSNYLSIPTDCPQRNERQGWTADTLAFAPSALYVANVAAFLRKWLGDLRDVQQPDGSFASAAPRGAYYGHTTGRTGWGDAGVLVPYLVWKFGGGTSVLDENWDAMMRYLGFLARKTATIPVATTWEYGDWLSFEKLESLSGRINGADGKPTAAAFKWWSYLTDAYYLWDARAMREMAAARGRADEAARFGRLADSLRTRMRKRYLPDGRLYDEIRDMQTANLFALKLGLFAADAAREEAKRRLLANFDAHGGCLQTGFLGTAILMDTLTEIGETRRAYDLLLNRTFPGWLYTVDNGATTAWERWNSYTKEKGFGPVGMNSFNHYAYGSVLAWLYSTAAGMRPPADGAGFDRFTLAPQPDRRLGSCTATFRTPKGEIRSAWRYEGVKWIWEFTVPPGAEARVRIPGESAPTVYSAGTYRVARDDR